MLLYCKVQRYYKSIKVSSYVIIEVTNYVAWYLFSWSHKGQTIITLNFYLNGFCTVVKGMADSIVSWPFFEQAFS